jgi:hypothetical protein
VTPARRTAALVLLGVVVLVCALIVLVRNRSPDDELLATIGLAGGLAIVIVSLPSGPPGPPT